MKFFAYVSALPNKICQSIIDDLYPEMRYLLSPNSQTCFGEKRMKILTKTGYAIDNGVYTYFTKGIPFDSEGFIKLLDRYADGADWIVLPDVVGDWAATYDLCFDWLERLKGYKCPKMVVAQDGCELEDFKQIIEVLNLDDVCGIFIGGSTDWKLNNIAKIAQICRSMDKLCHVGRVNSASRLRFAFDCGATSIDGSGASRFKPTTKIICKQLNEIKATENQLPLFDFL